MAKKTKQFFRMLACLLSITFIVTTGMVVMADDASNDYINGMTKVASLREDIDDDTYIIKDLYLNVTNNTRGFADTRYGTVVHSIYSNSGSTLQIQILGNATFTSQLGADVIYVGGSYTTYVKGSSNGWELKKINDTEESNVKPLFGAKYAKYSIDYTYTNGISKSLSDTAWIKCDVNGNISNNSKTKAALAPNQVVVGNDIISFG